MISAMDTAQDPLTLSRQVADSCKSLMKQAGSQKERFRFYSPSECRSYEPPEGHVLVGDCHIVRGNITVLSGAPGTGKSRAATYLAIAGAIKCDWFGLPVHSQFKTAILQAENGRYRLKTELNDMKDSSLDDFIRISEPPECGMAFRDAAFRDDLRDWMAGFKPDLVVLDPWNAITGDDSQRDYREALNNVREAMPKGDIEPAILIVAHNRKPKNDERKTGRGLLNEIAGSHVITSAARCAFIMQAASDDEEDDRVVGGDGGVAPEDVGAAFRFGAGEQLHGGVGGVGAEVLGELEVVIECRGGGEATTVAGWGEAIGEQPTAIVTSVANAAGDAGEAGEQGGAEAVGQEDGEVEAPAAQTSGEAKGGFAGRRFWGGCVGGRRDDQIIAPGDRIEQGVDVGAHEGGDVGVGEPVAHGAQGGCGHNDIADP